MGLYAARDYAADEVLGVYDGPPLGSPGDPGAEARLRDYMANKADPACRGRYVRPPTLGGGTSSHTCTGYEARAAYAAASATPPGAGSVSVPCPVFPPSGGPLAATCLHLQAPIQYKRLAPGLRDHAREPCRK